MAALNRPVTATYAVDETICVDTIDNEDHTFCGIMFPIRAKNILPIEKIIIQSVAVRGQLGNISIWISNAVSKSSNHTSRGVINNSNHQNMNTSLFRLSPKYWTKVYEQEHKPSRRVYKHMDLTTSTEPVVLLPGEVRILYIHSTLESDAAIVYDNTQTNPFGGPMNASSIRYEDDKIAIHTGKAHLSFVPFGQEPIWGWGNAWRDRREFVGQIQYGTVYKLWHPERHNLFGHKFHKGTESLLLLQRRNTLFSRLPDECIYYILHMCHWDWFGDTSREMNVRNRNRKRILREEQERQRMAAQQELQLLLVQQQQQSHATVPEKNDATTSCKKHCHKNSNSNDGMEIDENNDYDDNDDDDEDFVDAEEDGDDDGGEGDDDDDDDALDNNDQDDNNDDDEDDINDPDDIDDEDEDDDWERAHGYRADISRFIFHHASSDDEDDDQDDDTNNNNMHGRPWFGPRVARQLIVHALGGRGRSNLGR